MIFRSKKLLARPSPAQIHALAVVVVVVTASFVALATGALPLEEEGALLLEEGELGEEAVEEAVEEELDRLRGLLLTVPLPSLIFFLLLLPLPLLHRSTTIQAIQTIQTTIQ